MERNEILKPHILTHFNKIQKWGEWNVPYLEDKQFKDAKKCTM